MQRLPLTFTLPIEKLRSDKSFQIDQTEKNYELIKYFFPLIADITDAERDMIYEGSLLPNVVVNHQRHYDNSNSELRQGTKPSEQTHGKSTAPSVVENTETITPSNTYDKPVITNHDGNIANEVKA